MEDNRSQDTIQVQAKHPLWIRWTHWINFPILMLMLFSGAEIYWANDAYTPFIPGRFYAAVGIDYRLPDGMALHFATMWILVVNGACYLAYMVISGEWKELIPRLSSFRQALLVVLHDLGLRKELPLQGKFNAAQRIAYSAVLAMAMGAVATGLAIYKPIQLHWLVFIFGGYESARLIHFLLAVGIAAFFLLHIVQVVRAGWNNFQAMVTGLEVVHEQEHKQT
jgi:thiosulfate reductase cytochrome b subunit